LTHSQIAKQLDIPKSSLTLILRSLVEYGYLHIQQPGNTYSLGSKVLLLAGHLISNQDLVKIGTPILEGLVAEIEEPAFMAVLNDMDVVYVSRINSPKLSVTSSVQVGQRAPIFKTSAGKSILAFQGEAKVAHIIEDLMKIYNGEIDSEALLAELQEIRVNGFSVCREEFQKGVISLGAPIFNFEGRVVMAITVALPISHHTKALEKEIAAKLLVSAKDFSNQLGFSGKIMREKKKKDKIH
jgi:DNA-binding IclR family transcriptional regulator